MNLTKNQIYIISAIVILVVAYYLFFRKKPVKMMKKESNPAPAPSESGWEGQWEYTPEMEMDALSGTFDPYAQPGESGFRAAIGGSIGGDCRTTGLCPSGQRCDFMTGKCNGIESSYDGIGASQVPPASSVLSLGTDWLARPKSSDFVQQESGWAKASPLVSAYTGSELESGYAKIVAPKNSTVQFPKGDPGIAARPVKLLKWQVNGSCDKACPPGYKWDGFDSNPCLCKPGGFM